MKTAIGRILLCLFVLVSVMSCGSGVENVGQEGLCIRTAVAVESGSAALDEYPFISKPFRTSELSFRISGPIDRLEVYPGRFFKRGDIIAEIDPRDFRVDKDRSEAVYKQMKAEYERIEALYQKGNVSASTREKANADYIAARTAYNEACYRLEDTHLLAPFDGYVGDTFIEKFQDVRASQPVLSLIDISRLKIEIYVTQEVALYAEKAGSAEVVFDTAPDKKYQAKIVEVSKGAGRNNLSFTVTALLPNDGSLLAGMSGKVSIRLPEKPSPEVGAVLPVSSLCHCPEMGDYVYIVDSKSSTVSLRQVSGVSLLSGGMVRVASGINVGECVATTGLRFLSDGMKVVIK
ncbi:MAG: efflux RND transporter periplasmic adaptor subunit [Candidatus Cryptobacteroides sp.]